MTVKSNEVGVGEPKLDHLAVYNPQQTREIHEETTTLMDRRIITRGSSRPRLVIPGTKKSQTYSEETNSVDNPTQSIIPIMAFIFDIYTSYISPWKPTSLYHYYC
jgi:hypothetical protein